jgi:hypothetical protein
MYGEVYGDILGPRADMLKLSSRLNPTTDSRDVFRSAGENVEISNPTPNIQKFYFISHEDHFSIGDTYIRPRIVSSSFFWSQQRRMKIVSLIREIEIEWQLIIPDFAINVRDHILRWRIAGIFPNGTERPSIIEGIPTSIPLFHKDEGSLASDHSFARKVGMAITGAPQSESERGDYETGEGGKEAIVVVKESSRANHVDDDGVGLFIGCFGGLFAAILTYAAVERWCKIIFSPKKKRQKNNDGGNKW